MTLVVRLLGSVQISHDDQPISIRGYKAAALLAYLLLTGKAHSRQHLIDLLFDGPDDPKASLRWILSELRQAIGPDFILADRQQVAFDFAADYWLDVAAFEAGQIELYRGDFLEGLNVRDAFGFEEWALFERERLRRSYQNALTGRLEAYSGQGDYPGVIETAHQLLRLDNLREEWYRAVMQAHARQGQREAAMAQYDLCCQVLQEELGTAPAEETTNLAEQIRTGLLAVELSETDQPQDIQVNPPPFLDPPDGSATDDTVEDRAVFVARELELRQLDSFLDLALAGQGQVVFVTGDAGSGKTSLVQEFTQRAQTTQPKLIVAGGNCDAFTGVGDPYLPFRELLELLTGDVEARWASGAMSREHARRLWSLIPQSVQALVDSGPELLDIFVSSRTLVQRAATAASSGENWLSQLKQLVARQQARSGSTNLQQTNLLEQYTKVLQVLARQQPLLLVLDDLQWADLGSLNLLFHLGRRLRGHCILIIGIYRQADVALGREGQRHPLEPVVNEFQRDYGQIQVDLNQTEGRSFIRALLDNEPHRLGATFQEALYRHSQGHALFSVEILRGMQERGDLVQDEQGRWIGGPTLDWDALPARVEGVIGERIGRLPVALQEILKVASVEGEVFTAEVVAQVQRIDKAEVVRQFSSSLDRQHRLVRSQRSLLLSSGHQRLSQYRFRHILFQRYLYYSLDEVERTYLHESVGSVLEQLYKGQLEDVAVELARHFQMAGLVVKAVDYLQQAGDRAARLSAHKEAIAHFSKALTLLESLADPGQYAQQELSLQIALGHALITIKGSAAPEVEQTFSRARALSQQVGDTPQAFQVLFGLYGFYSIRGEIEQTARELAEQCLHFAQGLQDPSLLIIAQLAVGVNALYRGDLTRAQAHLERGLALYDPQTSTSLIALYGLDPGVVCRRISAWVKWLLGYPQQAKEEIHKALTLSQELAHPFDIAGALATTCTIYHHCREAGAVKAWADKTINLATEYGFAIWKLHGTMLRAWALAEWEEEAEGIEQTRQDLEAYYATGTRAMAPLYLSLLAEAHMKMGQVTEGLTVLEQALTRVEKSGERFWEAELYRLKGELLSRKGADDGEIEQQVLKAINTAREQSARSLELRATVSLGRLWQAQGKRKEARQTLAKIYDWFTEGFDTIDLKEAQALLDELS
jgi:DNA-binding SARP family transcriptional activator/predicted ATPase